MFKKFKAWRKQRETTTFGCIKPSLMADTPRNREYRNRASQTAIVIEGKDRNGVVSARSLLDLARYDADPAYRIYVSRNGRMPKKPLRQEIKEVGEVMTPWYAPWRWDWKEVRNQATDVGNWIVDDLVEDQAKNLVYAGMIALALSGPVYLAKNAWNTLKSEYVSASIAAENYRQEKTGNSQMQIEGYPQDVKLTTYDGVGGIQRSSGITLAVKDLYGGVHDLSYVTTPDIADLTLNYLNGVKGKRCVIPVDRNRVAGIRCEK